MAQVISRICLHFRYAVGLFKNKVKHFFDLVMKKNGPANSINYLIRVNLNASKGFLMQNFQWIHCSFIFWNTKAQNTSKIKQIPDMFDRHGMNTTYSQPKSHKLNTRKAESVSLSHGITKLPCA